MTFSITARERLTTLSSFASIKCVLRTLRGTAGRRKGEKLLPSSALLLVRNWIAPKRLQVAPQEWKFRVSSMELGSLFSPSIYRVKHHLADLGWEDFNFCYYTVCQILLGQKRVWQNGLSSLPRWVEYPIKSQPNPGSRADGSPCIPRCGAPSTSFTTSSRRASATAAPPRGGSASASTWGLSWHQSAMTRRPPRSPQRRQQRSSGRSTTSKSAWASWRAAEGPWWATATRSSSAPAWTPSRRILRDDNDILSGCSHLMLLGYYFGPYQRDHWFYPPRGSFDAAMQTKELMMEFYLCHAADVDFQPRSLNYSALA